MNTIFVFDTETDGIPNWKIPSNDPSQPHIVSIAGLIVDADTTDIIQTLDVIVRPDGWKIPQECVDVHGITTEYAMDVGLPERVVADMVMAMAEGRKRVAYNTTFDNRIIRIALKRFFSESTADAWTAGDYECAMIAHKKAVGGKQVKLTEAYKHWTGLELKDAHSAMADTLAAMEVYFAIKSASPQEDKPAAKAAPKPVPAVAAEAGNDSDDMNSGF